MADRAYLPHDLGTRNDPKMVALEIADFPIGKAIWWDLLEMLFEQGGKLPTDYKMLSYLLRYPTPEQIKHLVEDFDLFEVEDGMFFNRSALVRIARKEETSTRRRDAGIVSGRARNSKTLENPSVEQANEQMFNKCSTNVQQEPNTCSDDEGTSVEQSNQIKLNKNKINQSACAGACAPTPAGVSDEDFLMTCFVFRNFAEPAKEVERCLEHYKDGMNDRLAVGKKWNPDNTAERFDDGRALKLARDIYDNLGVADKHKAAEFLRHIDTIQVDRGENSVKIRMYGKDWKTTVLDVLAENPAFTKSFSSASVTNRVNS